MILPDNINVGRVVAHHSAINQLTARLSNISLRYTFMQFAI
tara:strand:- start:37852 stop:37974 length:123 start_codon:yes stop_codon:yes gene_type:complete